MTSVRLEKIAQTFGGNHLLRGLNLSVDSGDYVVLLGPSGCGKTTTLRIIAGLQLPDQGNVLFDDKPVNQIAPHQRDVAMVFQHDGLYPHLTVAESIRFALKGKVSSAEMKARVDEAIGLTQIESILQRYPSRLSGGELRRAAVAKAIARRTSVRLLDEPLSALDVPIRHSLQDDILRWHATVPGTSIHVTHDGQEAMRMADKIAVMEAGRIVQFATPQEVFSQPRTVSVAKAIGSPPINLFPARLAQGTIVFRNPSISALVDLGSASPDRDILVGIRPDSFRLAATQPTTEPESSGLFVSGQVIRSQSVQRDRHLQLNVNADSMTAVIPSESLVALSVSGETIRLMSPSDAVHLFDAQSGDRIETKSDR